MLHSRQLSANPDLYIFLPVLYVVWSDSMLTPSEVKAMESAISKQEWLSKDEQKFLFSQIDPANQPSALALRDWLVEIRSVLDPGAIEHHESLIDIGIRLATARQGALKFNNANGSLRSMEIALGIINKESFYYFYPEKRKTITQSRSTKRSFDPEKLADILEGDHKQLIARVKTLLADPAFAYVDPSDVHSYREKVLEWCRILAQHGLGSMGYPKEFGGGGDMNAYFTIMETLSYHDLSLVIKFGVQFGLFGMSVYFLGTEKHHKKYLSEIGSLKLPGCFAMTETNHGSNVRSIETTATYQKASNTFIIHTPHPSAQKEYIGNAALHGQMGTVFAKMIIDGKDYGVSAFLVPLRDELGKTLPGIAIEDCGRKMGLNGVDNGKIRFDNISIPYDNLLDRFAQVVDGKFTSPLSSDNKRFFTMLGTLVGGRIGIPRSGLSAVKSGLAIAVRYGDQRKQFGPEGAPEIPILNYRTHQRRLIPRLANAYALHFALRYLTDRFLKRTDDEMQEIEAIAAGLKAFSTWNTTATLQECRECCGGKGYLSENRIDSLKNDTEIYTTFEGDNTVLMQLVAKSRLSEFKKEFSNMDLFGMLNYVADQAKTSLSERNPVAIRKTDEEHLVSSEFHLNAFRYRERDILTSAAKRLKRHIEGGMDSFDAFNVVQHHLVQVGFAYIERIILEQFVSAIEKVKDGECRNVLTKLCRLFALSQIDINKGWYLENGYMEGVKTKAIRKLVNELSWDIRQDAVPLVEAFRIPDNLLSAPIVTQNNS